MLSSLGLWMSSRRPRMSWSALTLVVYGSLVTLGAVRFYGNSFPWQPKMWAECVCALAACGLVSFAIARRLGSRGPRLATRGDGKLGRQFVALAESSVDAIFVLEDGGQHGDFSVRFGNAKARSLLGADEAKVREARLAGLMPFMAAEGFVEKLREVGENGRTLEAEIAVKDARIAASWLRLRAVPFEGGVLLTIADLSEQKEMEAATCRRLQHDALTGLPNRTLLDDRMQQALERARRSRGSAGVLMLDLDGFTRLNETYGQTVGDQVLKVVAARLRRAVRASDSVFRLGGDKFVVLLADLPGDAPVADFARKLMASLEPAIPWKGKDLRVTASAGVAVYPAAGTTPETLLVEADIDMGRAKRCERARRAVEAEAGVVALRRLSLIRP